MKPGEALLGAAVLLVAWYFWRLHERLNNPLLVAAGVTPAPSVVSVAPTAPPGTPYIPLGQFAVAPSKRWLVLPPGS
jgi:hypothetical protein